MADLSLGRPGQLYKDSETAFREDVVGTRPAPALGRTETAPSQRNLGTVADRLFGNQDVAQPPEAQQEQQPQTQQQQAPRQTVADRLFGSEPLVTEQETPKEEESGDFYRGGQAALQQTPALLKGAVGLVGATGEKALGEGGMFSALKKYGLEGYQAEMQDIASRAKDTDSASKAWERAKGGDLGALLDWAQYGAGYLAGNIAETALTAVAGSVVGTMVGGPAGTLAGGAAGVTSKEAVKGVTRNVIESMVAKEAAQIAEKKGVTEITEQIAKEATKNVAGRIGSTTALAASGIAKSSGGIYGEAEEQAAAEGRELDALDLARVWGSGVVAGLSEMVVDRLGLDVATGRLKIPGANSRVGSAMIGAGIGAGVEGGQEVFQTAVERFGAAKPLTGEEALTEYIDGFALGALGGGTIGGITGAARGGQPADSGKDKIKEILAQAEQEINSDGGRAELFDAMMQDERAAAVLQQNGIASGDDPRFQSVITRHLATQRMLAELDTPTPEQIEERRKQRGEDVQAAFGATASTSVGVGTGADQPVLRRDSVVPDPETRELVPIDGEPQTAALPDGAGSRAGTVAMSGEDIVAAQQGYEVLPAFQLGEESVANRFLTAAQAETFLYGPVNKETGKRAGGYASSVDDMEFQIRRGQRSKAAGGGAFYFIEGRERQAETPPTPPAAPAAETPAAPPATPPVAPPAVTETAAPPAAPPAPVVTGTAAVTGTEAKAPAPAPTPEPPPAPTPAPAPAQPSIRAAATWDAFNGPKFDTLPDEFKSEWEEAITEGYKPTVLASLYANLSARVTPATPPAAPPAEPPAAPPAEEPKTEAKKTKPKAEPKPEPKDEKPKEEPKGPPKEEPKKDEKAEQIQQLEAKQKKQEKVVNQYEKLLACLTR